MCTGYAAVDILETAAVYQIADKRYILHIAIVIEYTVRLL